MLDESGEVPPGADKKEEKQAQKTKPSLLQSLVEVLSGDAKKSEPAKEPAAPEPKRSPYDRLYVDLNRDLDLTNDRVLKPMEAPPWNGLPQWPVKERMAFEYLDLDVDYGPGLGVRPFRVLPWLAVSVNPSNGAVSNTMYFVATVARQGRIRFGQHAYDALLVQPGVQGRFDGPWTGLFLKSLDGKDNVEYMGFATGLLMSAHQRDGVLYTTSATPLGNKLIVKPYRGDFGIIKIGAGGRNIKEMGLRGSLDSKTMAISLKSRQPQAKEQKTPAQEYAQEYEAPAGDYCLSLVSVQYGRLKIELSDNYHADGEPRAVHRIRNYFVKIRKDKPLVLDFANKPRVLFASPAKDKTFKPGDEIQVKAVLIDPVCDFMIRGLDDSSRKEKKTYKLADGKEFSRNRVSRSIRSSRSPIRPARRLPRAPCPLAETAPAGTRGEYRRI